MSQQAARYPHRTSAAPGHRRRRSPRLLLAAALLALPLSACAGQLTSAPNQATHEVTVKATALSAPGVTIVLLRPTYESQTTGTRIRLYGLVGASS